MTGETPLPVALTEYNVRTGSSYDAIPETLDTPGDFAALGANSVALTEHFAKELYLFKFGQTERTGGTYPVSKNGTHYVNNDTSGFNNYGGATKGAEVYRLFHKAAQGGRMRFNFTSNAGSDVWPLFTYDPAANVYYAFIANKNTSAVVLDLDVSAFNIPNGNNLIIEEVSAASSGGVSVYGQVNSGHSGPYNQPAESVWLVSIPLMAQTVTAIDATEDTILGDGTQKNTTGGAAAQLQARADGTVNGRRVTLLKFPVSSLTPNALQRVLLSLTASAITQNANVQAHVYGVNNDSWTESAATWATFTPALRQNVAAGNKIANNIVANPFTTTQMLGQMVVTSAADSEKMVDVTEFVRGQTDGFASFMIVQDHRWDTALPSLTAGDTQADGIKIVAKEAGTVSAPGPRLRVISNQTGTTAPTIITHPASQSVTVGSSASFSVVAGGTAPLTYQWRKDGTPINGATSAGYTLTATVAGDAGSYSVVVTNAQGSATSNGATLTVNSVPALPAEDDVIINEFVVNPVSGKEYVELLVVKPGGVNLQGWTISDLGTRSSTPGTTGGDITLPASASYLNPVPQGTYVVIAGTKPSANTNTLTEDVSVHDGNNKLVLIAGATTGLTTSGSLDISTNENIALFAGTRAAGALIDQVLCGTSTDLYSGAVWGDNNAATTTDNINGGASLADGALARFVPTSNTLAGFQDNDTGARFIVTANSYGTPGAVNSGVSDSATSNPAYAANAIPAGSYTGLNINGNATAAGDVMVHSALTLASGTLDAGANTVTLGPSATVTRTGGYVLGKLKKLSVPSSFTFPVGTTPGGYAPVTLNAVTGSGDFTVSATEAKLPGIGNPLQAVKLYWNLTNGGLTSAMPQFQYQDAHLDTATEANLRIIKDTNGSGAPFIFPDGNAIDNVDDATNTATLQSATTTFSNWSLAAPESPTLAQMAKFEAYHFADGNLLRWQTGYEIRNLGFIVYRQDGPRRVRVTPDLIAGSALRFGDNTALTAGQGYSWRDYEGRADSIYYVEDIDLDGKRTLHGPITLQDASGRLSDEIGSSLTLNGLRPAGNGTGRRQQAVLPDALNANNRPTPGTDAWQQQLRLAAGAAVKLQVRENGWYRVTHSQLAAAGLNANAAAENLQLYLNGAPVPLSVRLGNDGALDAIEFYGVGTDTRETDSNTYWLIAGDAPGLRFGPPVRVAPQGDNGGKVPDADAGSTASARSFPFTVERKDRVIYAPGILNGAVENFFGAVISGTVSSQTVRVNRPDIAAPGQATITIALQGATLGAHRVSAQFNGNDLGVIEFIGQEHKAASFSVAQSLLREGDNTITLRALNGSADVSATDYLRITYAHRFQADNNRLLFMTGNRRGVTINGFTAPDARVFDVTEPGRYFEVKARVTPDPAGYEVAVAGNLAARVMLAVTDEEALTPVAITSNAPSAWTNANHSADFVIITPQAFSEALQPLVNLRRSQGLRTEVIMVEDLYDEWNGGTKSAAALSDFMAWARSHWQTAPRYVLLAGDASFDPRNYLGYGDTDLMPTAMVDTASLETSSDETLVDFDGDGVGELSIGRLPARTLAQAETMTHKIVNYHPGNGGAVFAADHNFEAVNQAARNFLPTGLAVTEINRNGLDDDAMRSQIVNAFNAGPSIVQYAGHGSVEVWTGAGVLNGQSINSLTNYNALPLVVAMTCLNGYFHSPTSESLAERLLNAPNGGGVAVWASSGLTMTTGQTPMDRALFRFLYQNGDAPRLGDAARQAKRATTDSEVRRTWTLFGDPTMILR